MSLIEKLVVTAGLIVFIAAEVYYWLFWLPKNWRESREASDFVFAMNKFFKVTHGDRKELVMQINEKLSINPLQVASLKIDSRHYVNGADHDLVIEMANGNQHRVRHWPPQTDIWQIKYEIEMAMTAGQNGA